MSSPLVQTESERAPSGKARMALELSAQSPVVRLRPQTTTHTASVPRNRWFHYEPFSFPRFHSPSPHKMKSDRRKNVIFYSILCCHLTDRLRVMSGRPDAGILRLLFFLSDRHWQMSLFEPSVIFVCTFVLMHCTVFFLQCRLFLQQVRVCSNAQDVRVRVGSLHSQIAKASGAFFTQMLYFLRGC